MYTILVCRVRNACVAYINACATEVNSCITRCTLHWNGLARCKGSKCPVSQPAGRGTQRLTHPQPATQYRACIAHQTKLGLCRCFECFSDRIHARNIFSAFKHFFQIGVATMHNRRPYTCFQEVWEEGKGNWWQKYLFIFCFPIIYPNMSGISEIM